MGICGGKSSNKSNLQGEKGIHDINFKSNADNNNNPNNNQNQQGNQIQENVPPSKDIDQNPPINNKYNLQENIPPDTKPPNNQLNDQIIQEKKKIQAEAIARKNTGQTVKINHDKSVEIKSVDRIYQNFVIKIELQQQLQKQTNISDILIISGHQEKGFTHGRGTFGKVIQEYDFKTRKIYAAKYFNEKKDYDDEKKVYSLLKEKISNIDQFAIILEDYDDQNMKLIFKSGICNLKDYFQESNSKLSLNNIKYIFKWLINNVFEFRKYGIVHQDIKPENIVIIFEETIGEKTLILKYIDMGGVSKYLQPSCFTKLYFYNPKRKIDIKKETVYMKDDEERYKNEIYQVIRTMQRLFLLANFKQKQYDNKFNEQTSLQELIEIQELIEEDYKDQKDEELNLIFDYIKNKIIPENYSMSELEKFVEDIVQKHSFKNRFEDNDNIIDIIIKKKNQENQADLRDQLFSLNNYIRLKGTLDSRYLNETIEMDKFDLITKTTEFIFTPQEQKVMVLLGNSGGGKTLFLLQLMQEIEQKMILEKQTEKLYVYRVKFSDYKLQKDANYSGQLLQDAIKDYFNKIDDKNCRFLFLLDAYDELDDKDLKLNEIFKINPDSNVKIIMTSREKFQSIPELNKVLSFQKDEINKENNTKFIKTINPIIYYVCGFDQEQKEKYVNNFIKFARDTQEYTFYETFDKYNELFEKYKMQIQEMSQFPQTLRILLIILPKINENQQQQIKITRFQIYEQYLELDVRKEIFKKAEKHLVLLDEKYGIESSQLEQKDLKQWNELCNDILKMNIQLAYEMFKQKLLNLEIQKIKDLFIGLKYSEELVLLFIDVSIQTKNKLYQDVIEFQHKSVYEHYLAKGVLSDYHSDKEEFVSQCFLVEEIEAIIILGEEINENFRKETQKDLLQRYVKDKKKFERIEKKFSIEDDHKYTPDKATASNSITILNAADLELNNENFDCCEIPHAILSDKIWDGSSIQYANFYSVDLERGSFQDCRIYKTNLLKAQTGIIPAIEFKGIDDEQLIQSSPIYNQKVAYFTTKGKIQLVEVDEQNEGKWTEVCSGLTDRYNQGQKNDVQVVLSKNCEIMALFLEEQYYFIDAKQKKIIYEKETSFAYLGDISCNSEMIVTGSYFDPDSEVELYYLKEDKDFRHPIKFFDKKQQVIGLQFSNDYQNGGVQLLACNYHKDDSYSTMIRIWEIKTKKIYREFETDNYSSLLQFTNDNKLIIYNILNKDYCFIVQELDSQKIKHRLKSAYDISLSFQINNDDSSLVSMQENKKIVIWNLQNGEPMRELENTYEKHFVSFSKDQEKIISTTSDYKVEIQKIYNKKFLKLYDSADKSKKFTGYKQFSCLSRTFKQCYTQTKEDKEKNAKNLFEIITKQVGEVDEKEKNRDHEEDWN